MDETRGDPSAEDSPSTLTPVLRISQLDAFELDTALEQLVWSQFSQCFQHFKPGHLTPFEPELKALLQLLLWRFTVYSRSATAGQSLLNIRYKNDLSQARRYRPMSRRQKLWFALCAIGEKWLKERSHSLFLNRPAESAVHKARRALAFLDGFAKVASLLNFLVFLQKGRFPTLTERFLGVRAVFSRPQGVRDVGFQYVNRELLWHGFAEFLIFLFPLVNTRRLKASVRSLFSPPEGQGVPAEAAHCTECALCGEWPTMPHTVGCSHVFCYYCVKSHSIADMYLSCPKCGTEVKGLEPVKMQIQPV
ncbi:peroxisome biogenesis factor 2 [Anguilla anguilla]|uniref:peroxisome biogenesis factor 2 n=1 Tax=Anguilla anguilla TaxID=7936 RepID=UPI0015B2CC50|nr:peroxisome biogenesis factor 2 [Anguilla anguilla]